jgi:hypothetical protein
LFSKRIGIVVVVVVEDSLVKHAKKELFSHKKNILLLDNKKG